MNSPLFTIIIPLYNKEKYINKAIECVLHQTLDDFELIIIDDGSTDNSLSIANSFSDKRIKVIHQENGGVSKARNNGICRATGKYLSFLDADDEWMDDFLYTCYTLFNDFPEAKVVCPSYQMKYSKRVVNPIWRSVSTDTDCLVNDFFEMATAPCWIMTSSCVAVEAEAIRSLEYLFAENERVYEDYDMWLRLGAKFPVAHSPKICGIYNRVSETNARKVNKVVYSETFMNTIDKLIKSGAYSSQQIEWLTEIKDRRMVPYIFSLLLLHNREDMQRVLSDWKPVNKYKKYKTLLQIGSHLPYKAIELVQYLRLRKF